MWKKLLSSQRVNLRDCYFNQEFPGGIPVIVTTNNKKLFLQLAKSPLFYDQCYLLTLSDFMGPLNCKPSALQDDEETKRQKYHCGKHLADLSPIAEHEQPFLAEDSNDSERFKDAIKREEWSSCYKSCPEDERQGLLTKFAELDAEMQRLKSLYFTLPPPTPTINVYNNHFYNYSRPSSINLAETRSGEISYIKDHYQSEENKEGRSPTLKKKQFQSHNDDVGPPKNLVGGGSTTLRNRALIRSNNIPGVKFDGSLLPKVITGTMELVSALKLRRLLFWTKKRRLEVDMVPEPDVEMGKILAMHKTDEARDRQSFALFHAYLLCAKKTDVKIQEEDGLLAVETCYFPAHRMMRRSRSQPIFGRVYGGASYSTHEINNLTTTHKLTGTMQTFEKSRRAYLCEDIYWDLDQVNSHPSLLISLLIHLELPVPQLLKEYIEDREQVLDQIRASYNTDKATAKNLMLRLIYGGTVKNWVTSHQLDLPVDIDLDQKLEWFAQDLSQISEKLQKLPLFATAFQVYQSTYEEAEKTRTSFLSLICGEYERQVLMFVKLWLSQQIPQRHLDVLIHDGGLLRRLPGETEPPLQLLTDLNQELEKLFQTSHIKYDYKKFNNVLGERNLISKRILSFGLQKAPDFKMKSSSHSTQIHGISINWERLYSKKKSKACQPETIVQYPNCLIKINLSLLFVVVHMIQHIPHN